jgi:N-acetylmuramoyl-L-alanine amidase
MKTKATGGTSGRYTGVPEYQLNLDISKMLRNRLKEQGYQVIMTREDNDTAISNMERACMANEAGADISIRIHANGSEDSSAKGALAIIGSASNPNVGNLYEKSYALAESVLGEYCANTGMNNTGIQENDTMTGINWSQIPVMILEMGYMTNPTEDMLMATDDYQSKIAHGIADGIDVYMGSR